jgi:RNA polymerase sigma factor (sigma-70 family)
MKSQSDAYLIDQILSGSTSSFARLVDRYKTMAFTLAYRITTNREDAEEVVQDSFIKVYENLAAFRQKSKFSTWLYRIVYNTSITRVRKKRLLLQELDEKNTVYKDISQTENLLFGLTEEEAGEMVKKALALLSEEDRTIVTLYYLNESDIEEIHEITGLTKANIKIKLFRARKRLQAQICDYKEDVTLCTVNLQNI